MNISDVDIAKKFVSKAKSCEDSEREFSMSLLGFIERVQTTDNCAYSNESLDLDNVSIERVNPLVGYTDDNCILVTRESNSSKGQVDAFIHTNRVTLDAKIWIMETLLGVLVEIRDSQVIDPSEVTTHTVREKDLLLHKVYKDGDTFILEDSEGNRTFAILHTRVIASKVPHGRGFREVEFIDSFLVLKDLSIISSSISLSDYVKVHHLRGRTDD